MCVCLSVNQCVCVCVRECVREREGGATNTLTKLIKFDFQQFKDK